MLYVPVWLWVVIGIIVVAFVWFAAYWSVRTHRNKVTSGKEDLIGLTAVVEAALNPRGTVRVEGEIWNAVIDEGTAEPEDEVVITRVDGLKLQVTRKQ